MLPTTFFNVSAGFFQRQIVTSKQINVMVSFMVTRSVTKRAAARRDGLLASTAAALSSETVDVEAAVAAAVAIAGRAPSKADLELARSLKENLYLTAGDVAAMSQEELEMMDVPVKLWAIIKKQLHKASQGSSTEQQQDAQQQLQQQQTAALQQQLQQQHQQQDGFAAMEAASQQLSAASQLHPDIMQRRMPDARNSVTVTDRASASRVRRAQLHSRTPYGLQEHEMTPALRAELDALEQFSTTRFYGQLVEPLAPVTFHTVTKHYVKLMLGFAHRVRGVSLDQLSLSTLLPSSGREGVSLLMDYQHWRQQERGTAASTAALPIKACIHVARFLYHDQAQPATASRGGAKSRPYHDLEVVKELGQMQRLAEKAAAGAARVSDDSKKWLEWDDYLCMVRALRAECAGLTASGRPRSRSEVAASLQRYLIVAILSVVPDRQRTLRELEVGRTLQQRDGQWVIKHGPGDYKTGKQYGDRPPLVIAPFIYPELEAFISTWRQELQPKTKFLFCKPRTGEAMDEDAVYYTFKSAALRLTGKATHPHLVRDMIVTHARTQQRSEAQMEALALYMGHSLAMQRNTYDRRTKAQRVTPAVELLQGLWDK